MGLMKKWGGILFTFLFLSILVLGCQFKQEQRTGVVIEDVLINKINGNNCSVSFNVKNFDNFAVDCYAKISVYKKPKLMNLGIIEPRSEEKKQIFLKINDTNTPVKIEPVCRGVNSSTIQRCGNLKSYVDRRICEFEPENPQLEQCYARETGQEKLFCMALVTNNSEICQNFLEYKKYWCTAYITGDFSQCEKITDQDQKDECYTDIGMNKRNKDVCQKINNEAKKTSCMAVIDSDADSCLKGDPNSKLVCIINIIEHTGDKTVCEKLGDLKEQCYSYFEE